MESRGVRMKNKKQRKKPVGINASRHLSRKHWNWWADFGHKMPQSVKDSRRKKGG
jgi:predicted DNA-binding protein (MmcQ/YjbR family)